MIIYCARITGMGKTGRISRYYVNRQDAINDLTDRFPSLFDDNYNGDDVAVESDVRVRVVKLKVRD